MCDTCGCGNKDGYRIYDPHHPHGHDHDHTHEHEDDHDHDHNHEHGHDHEHPSTENKKLNLNLDILSGNNIAAGLNRRFFEGRKVVCLNMVSAPGSGKTTILEKTIIRLKGSRKIYVIEGDQQTSLDAERILKAGAPSIQVNTGSGCHLDAHMIEAALKRLDIESGSILFIENVGNLVCPAMFDLGENKRVIITSVTEGEDKPLKYPFMFESSHLCIINKTDLLPHVDFSIEKLTRYARSVNPGIEFITMSAATGEGMDTWTDWLLKMAGTGH